MEYLYKRHYLLDLQEGKKIIILNLSLLFWLGDHYHERKHWVRLWRKTSVLWHPIESCHITLWYLSLKPLIKTKQNDLRKKKRKRKKEAHCHTAASSDFCFLPLPSFACSNLHHTAHRSSPPHRSSKLCVELVNIPEPREPRSKGLFFMICPFPQFGFRIIDGFF